MNSVVLQTAARILLPVMLLLSVVALVRGHNEPGGGFVGGLVAAAGFALYALAFEIEDAKTLLRVSPRTLIGLGLLTATISGVPAVFVDQAFMDSLWFALELPGFGGPIKLGTPLIFDIGVYLTVVGIALLMIFTLEETRHGTALRD